MKKNKIILILAVTMMISPIFTLQAETTSPNTNLTNEQKKELFLKIKNQSNKEIKINIESTKEVLNTDIEARKTEVKKIIAEKKDAKKKLSIKSQEKVKATLEKIYTNLDASIEKLTGVDLKIMKKVATIKIVNKEVPIALAQYTIAKKALDKAITDIAATKAVSIDQTSVQTSKEAIRALVKTAEDSIKAAGTEYRRIIPLIIPGQGAGNVEAGNSSNVINQ